MSIPIYHIDAFADKPFSGNPASVCVLDRWLLERQLQLIANENSLPATAFLVRNEDDFQTRWFTPEYEIDLCGHGSLASAYVIFTFIEPTWKQADLHHSSGTLRVKKLDEFLTLELPVKNLDVFDSDTLIKGLGAKPKEIYQHKTERCLAVFDTEDEVRHLNPDMEILKNLTNRGIIVTAPSKNYDFVSRTFYPRKTAWEDAITGSSHCLLVPYWSKRLSKLKLHAYQLSNRGGEIFCEMKDGRVEISGKAILYARGIINL